MLFRSTTLRTEIDIVKDYIALEQMRYDFVIEMNVEEGRYLEQPTVRMLLQLSLIHIYTESGRNTFRWICD